jgi:hypothetical protein
MPGRPYAASEFIDHENVVLVLNRGVPERGPVRVEHTVATEHLFETLRRGLGFLTPFEGREAASVRGWRQFWT